ncbi:DUF4340 domain-containing protein [Candidatus Sumerlaeota bacterium]|nr:DUF4340 domain-containing protein [Candidatus Sumerlaeota bacterium]
MKTRTIGLLTLSLVVLGTVYYFDYRSLVRREAAQVERGRVCALDREEIDRIELRNPSGQFVLEKRSGEWWIARPRQLRADSTVVQGKILDALAQANKFSPFESRQSRLPDYGLDPASSVEIRVSSSDSERAPVRLRLGRTTAIQGECYLLDTAEPLVVYVTSASLRESLDLSLLALRDKAVLPVPAERVGGLRVETLREETPSALGATTTTLSVPRLVARRDASGSWWIADRPLADSAPLGPESGFIRGDDREMDTLLSALLTMEALDTTTSRGLAPTPALDTEIMRAVLEYPASPDDEHPTTFTVRKSVVFGLGPDGDARNLRAAVEDSDLVYEAERAMVSRLLGPLSSFRDRRILRIAIQDAAYMQIQVRNSAFAFERGADDVWRFADDPNAPVNQLKANAYLSVCLGLRVDSFDLGADPPSAKEIGLEPPEFSLMVRSRDGSVRERFEIGSRSARNASQVYARRIRPDEKGAPAIFLLALPESYNLALHKTRRFFTVKPLLEFDPERLDRIQLILRPENEEPSTLTLVRRGAGEEATWTGAIADRPAKSMPTPLADLLLSVLQEMEFQVELETDTANFGIVKIYGLDRPYLTLRILDAAGNELASLDLGRLAPELSEKQASLPESERSILVKTGRNVYRYVVMNQLSALDRALTAVAARAQ